MLWFGNTGNKSGILTGFGILNLEVATVSDSVYFVTSENFSNQFSGPDWQV